MKTRARTSRAGCLAAVALVVVGCSSEAPSDEQAASSTPDPVASPVIPGVVVTEGLSNDHVQGEVAYDQQPAVGGDHASSWLACKVYDEPVPDEYAVHSMEHGAVWLTYSPDLPPSAMSELLSLQRIDPAYVLVSPYPGLGTAVQATAWGLTLATDDVQDPGLEAFVEQYAGGGQGGEEGAPCVRNGITPEQARSELASPAPSDG